MQETDEVVLAKDISNCSECPLYRYDCLGMIPNGDGTLVEPPCTSWSDNDEIWSGMYERW